MELYIIRHGTTEWNQSRRLQGSSDIPLDEGGRSLARDAAKGMSGIRFDRCWSSPLKRAVETAGIILKGRNIPIETDERLREMGFGELEGHVLDARTDPDASHALELTIHGYRPPKGGETMEHLLERTASFFDWLVRQEELEDKRILISMHGASGRALMHRVWGGDSFWHGGIPKNCTVCIVRTERGQVTGWEQDVSFCSRTVPDYY